MRITEKIRWGLGIFFGLTFLALIVNGPAHSYHQKMVAKDFAQELREQGYTVKYGSVESPIAIFDVGYVEFMEVVKDSPLIVLDYYYLYCFSPDYVWGYKYTVEVEPDHPLSWIYPVGSWHHIIRPSSIEKETHK